MRTDHKASVALADVFIDNNERRTWSSTRALATIQHSFSGNERNRLFLNRNGRQFVDVSGISGLDSPADGRVLVVWDYDRDGWQDFAVVNSNTPLLNVFHNEIAPRRGRSSEDPNSRTHTAAANVASGETPAGGVIAVRFVGGNHTDQPSREYSAPGWCGFSP